MTGIRAILAALAILVTAVGCSSAEPPSAANPSPSASLAVDFAGFTPIRGSFCAQLETGAIAEVLGATPTSSQEVQPGDRPNTGAVRDVLDEFGCTYLTAQAEASAWIFAPPVTRKQARALRADLAQRPGCERLPRSQSPGFGTPGVAMSCTNGTRWAGLFGDSWVTCTVLADDTQANLVVRATRWCSAVLEAASN